MRRSNMIYDHSFLGLTDSSPTRLSGLRSSGEAEGGQEERKRTGFGQTMPSWQLFRSSRMALGARSTFKGFDGRQLDADHGRREALQLGQLPRPDLRRCWSSQGHGHATACVSTGMYAHGCNMAACIQAIMLACMRGCVCACTRL
jgi:hypothetical protein